MKLVGNVVYWTGFAASAFVAALSIYVFMSLHAPVTVLFAGLLKAGLMFLGAYLFRRFLQQFT